VYSIIIIRVVERLSRIEKHVHFDSVFEKSFTGWLNNC